METALILGINGSFGSHVAKSLAQQGYGLRALVRKEISIDVPCTDVEQVIGDVTDTVVLRQAMEGCDIVVYGVNPPAYDWEDKALHWLETVAGLAEEQSMTLVFPGNVYVYDPVQGPEFSEESKHCPVSRLGKIRQEMELRLQQAAKNGAQVIIVRAGDFIGAGARSSWLPFLLKNTRRAYVLRLPGTRELIHSWAYLPDLAVAVTALIEQRTSLPDFNEFHFKGYQYSFAQMATAITEATGKPVRLSGFPWRLVRILAPFSVMYRGLYEMRYLWQQEINLSGNKLQDRINQSLMQTPLNQALQEAQLV